MHRLMLGLGGRAPLSAGNAIEAAPMETVRFWETVLVLGSSVRGRRGAPAEGYEDD